MDACTTRTLSPTTHRQDIYIFGNGKKYLNFSSNDYLNIGTNVHLRNSFLEQILKKQNPFAKNLYGEALFSSSSSRLLSGNTAPCTRLETFLAKWFEKESALLFNSGYHANLGIIAGLMQKGDCIFSDKLNHNSILAGIRQSDADYFRYKHLDCAHLEDLLKKHRSSYKNALIVSESVFSMDGDKASLNDLITLKEKYQCLLMIDEAHGIGVLGETAQGLCAEEKTFFHILILSWRLSEKHLARKALSALRTKRLSTNSSIMPQRLFFQPPLPPYRFYGRNFC